MDYIQSLLHNLLLPVVEPMQFQNPPVDIDLRTNNSSTLMHHQKLNFAYSHDL